MSHRNQLVEIILDMYTEGYSTLAIAFRTVLSVKEVQDVINETFESGMTSWKAGHIETSNVIPMIE